MLENGTVIGDRPRHLQQDPPQQQHSQVVAVAGRSKRGRRQNGSCLARGAGRTTPLDHRLNSLMDKGFAALRLPLTVCLWRASYFPFLP